MRIKCAIYVKRSPATAGDLRFLKLDVVGRPGSGGRRCRCQLAVSDPQNHLQLVSLWVAGSQAPADEAVPDAGLLQTVVQNVQQHWAW